MRALSHMEESVRRRILEVVFRRLSPADWDVTLFGSFARGTATPASDIDIALQGPGPLPTAAAERIIADLEESVPMLRDFDLVDLSTANPALKKRVQAEGKSWHRATKTA